jgi:hypothetical protein
LVEHDLAKVGVASSSLVSRSIFIGEGRRCGATTPQNLGPPRFLFFAEGVATLSQAIDAEAGWQSGHAAACKAVYAGSIPTLASTSPDPRSARQ